MTEEMRLVAERLYNKLTREHKKAVHTIGVGESAQGNPVLVAYVYTESLLIPEVFEDFSVLPVVVPSN